MTKQPAKPDDPEQSKRFIDAAREAEADETAKGADRAFKAAVKSPNHGLRGAGSYWAPQSEPSDRSSRRF
jgi:hypothetical protein